MPVEGSQGWCNPSIAQQLFQCCPGVHLDKDLEGASQKEGSCALKCLARPLSKPLAEPQLANARLLSACMAHSPIPLLSDTSASFGQHFILAHSRLKMLLSTLKHLTLAKQRREHQMLQLTCFSQALTSARAVPARPSASSLTPSRLPSVTSASSSASSGLLLSDRACEGA